MFHKPETMFHLSVIGSGSSGDLIVAQHWSVRGD